MHVLNMWREKMSKCTCEEPIIDMSEGHLFEMCYRCNKLRELDKFDLWIKKNLEKILGELK